MSKASAFSKHAHSLRDHLSGRRQDGLESFAAVGGFSVAGLSLACIAAKLMANGDFSGLTLLLVLALVPVAVTLGFALESSGR